MSNCTVCGRALKDGEICNCSISESVSKDYFKVSLNKDTLKTIGDNAKNFAQMITDKNEGVYVRANDGAYENGLAVSCECVLPVESEVPIRQYNIARLSTPLFKKGFGRLQVTNKRVIFRSAGKTISGPVVNENEFAIKDISGIDIKSDYRFNWIVFLLSLIGKDILASIYFALLTFIAAKTIDKSMVPTIIVAILTVLFSIALLVMVPKKHALKSAAFTASASSLFLLSGVSLVLFEKLGFPVQTSSKSFVFAAILAAIAYIVALVQIILAGIVEDLRIVVKTKEAQGAIEIGRRRISNESTGFLLVKPWIDTQSAMRDLGAMIDDIKNYGDAAISKWKNI